MAKQEKPKVLTYQQAYDLALRAGSRFPAVVAAQFGLETDWGRRNAKARNNLFNIKWHEPSARKLRAMGINVTRAAEGARDNQTGSVDHYMEFDSVQDAFHGYQAFIEVNPRYGEALKARTAMEYLQGIKQAGYAQDPKYIESIIGVAKGGGVDLQREARYSDDQIAAARKKSKEELAEVGNASVKVLDGIPAVPRYDSPKNRAAMISTADFSDSTFNSRQYDRLEQFMGKHLTDGSAQVSDEPEAVLAKMILDKADTSVLEEVPTGQTMDEIDGVKAPTMPKLDLEADYEIIKQADGGIQPNGRRSTFTREEDLKAQTNTYNPLKLF